MEATILEDIQTQVKCILTDAHLVEAFSNFSWPIVAIIFILSFKKELINLLSKLSYLIDRIKSIEKGDAKVSFDMENQKYENENIQTNNRYYKSPSLKFVKSRSEIREPNEESIRKHYKTSVSISNIKNAEKVKRNLQNNGFNAEIYKDYPGEEKKKYHEHEAIWIGKRIPPNVAIEIIKIAIKTWPHLKYLHLSGDHGSPPDYVHDTIYLGGATSTAKRYNLKPWANEAITEFSEQMDFNDFHFYIRRKNYL